MRWIRRFRWRWFAPVSVLILAAVLRLWALGRPDQLVFDEIYYVRDAVSQLAHGFPTTWPDDDPTFGGERARAFTDQASAIAHPPLGKWLIGLGILLLGPDSGWGWRIAAAASGIATVAVTMRLGWLMSRNLWVACLAGALLAVDGVHVVLSRVGLLDGFLTLLIAVGALFVWKDQAGLRGETSRGGRGAILWRRPWLLAAGLAFGAAAAVKWSGLYPLAGFLLLITARDLILRLRIASAAKREAPHPSAVRREGPPVLRAWLDAARQALVAALIALPAALLAYLASWIGWILNPGAQDREPGAPWWISLWEWHSRTFAWHTGLDAEHPYEASPWSWPLALRPTNMYSERIATGPDCPWSSGCAAVVDPLPNPLVTWGGVLALLLLGWIAGRAVWCSFRGRSSATLCRPELWVTGFVLTGYLSGWLPWLLTVSRSAVFQFYAVVLTPFAALALALALGMLIAGPGDVAGRELADAARIRLDPSPPALLGRRVAVAIFALGALVLAVLFFPLWSGMPVAEWFWRVHIWLPGWS